VLFDRVGLQASSRSVDSIGVLIFDNSFQWAVPMRHAEDKSLIKRLVSGITPDGGTQIAPALTEAYRKVIVSKGTYKHIVLLTDGISEEGDSIELAKDAAEHQVTISTVGLGQDVNGKFQKIVRLCLCDSPISVALGGSGPRANLEKPLCQHVVLSR